MNESRTCADADTNLTQPRSPAVPESSIAKRARELMAAAAKLRGEVYVPPTKRMTPLEYDLAREETDIDHTVYFLYAAGRIKIGYTAGDPDKRESVVGNHCPLPVSTVKIMPGGAVTEFRVHHQFRSDRLHSEWFALSPELESFIQDDRLKEAELAYLRWLKEELARMEAKHGSTV